MHVENYAFRVLPPLFDIFYDSHVFAQGPQKFCTSIISRNYSYFTTVYNWRRKTSISYPSSSMLSPLHISPLPSICLWYLRRFSNQLQLSLALSIRLDSDFPDALSEMAAVQTRMSLIEVIIYRPNSRHRLCCGIAQVTRFKRVFQRKEIRLLRLIFTRR